MTAKETEPRSGAEWVEIASIIKHEQFQARKGLTLGTVKRYAMALKQGAAFPPITLARMPRTGALVLIDGWHRLAAGMSDGRGFIEAVVVDATVREAEWLAVKLNQQHGERFKASELRGNFRKYIKARKHRLPDGKLKSYRVIAQELGGDRSYSTIRNWMRKDHRIIFYQYAADEEQQKWPDGGLVELPEIDRFAVAAHAGLDQVETSFTGVESQARRAGIIERIGAMGQELRLSAEWDDSAF